MAKATCPSCGAPGEAGKECEFCGTLIPKPAKKTAKKDKTSTSSSPFSWYNVCPTGWCTCKDAIIGDASTSLYMVVSHLYLTNSYAVINRDGKFVKDPESFITLFTDNYDCLVDNGIYNIVTGDTIELDIDPNASKSIGYEYLVVCATRSYTYTAFYDRHKRRLISFNEPIYRRYLDSLNKVDKNTYVFKTEYRTWEVRVQDDKGIVTFKERKKQADKEKQTDKTQDTVWGCIFAFIIVCFILVVIFFIGLLVEIATDNHDSRDVIKNSTTVVDVKEAERTELEQWRTRFQEEFVGKEYVSDSFSKELLRIRVLDNTTLQYQTGIKDGEGLEPYIKWEDLRTAKYQLEIDGSDDSKSLVWTFDDYICEDIALMSTHSFRGTIYLEKNRDRYDFTVDDGVDISVVKQKQDEWRDKFDQLFVGEEFSSVHKLKVKKEFRFKVIDNSTIQYQTGERGDYPNDDILVWSRPQTVPYSLSIDVIHRIIDDYVQCTLIFATYKSEELRRALNWALTDDSYDLFQLKSTEGDQFSFSVTHKMENE